MGNAVVNSRYGKNIITNTGTRRRGYDTGTRRRGYVLPLFQCRWQAVVDACTAHGGGDEPIPTEPLERFAGEGRAALLAWSRDGAAFFAYRAGALPVE